MDTPEQRLIQRLRDLTAELEAAAQAAAALDPLFELGFALQLQPAGPGATRLELVARYLSGHGAESAYALEDQVLMHLGGGWARRIAMTREGLPHDHPAELQLSDAGIERLTAAVRAFYLALIPAPAPALGDG